MQKSVISISDNSLHMGEIKKQEMIPVQQTALENRYRNGSSPSFRMRCKAVLLKA